MRLKRNKSLVALALLAPLSAHAHHVMDGKVPGSFMQGLLSGLAHPVLGIDHFIAVLAIGILASLSKRPAALIAIFFASLLLGVCVHVARLDVPMVELGIALSLVACGLLLLRNSFASPATAGLVIAVAGAFHGVAYGESIIGAETLPLGAYLLGLVVVQSVIALAIGHFFRLVQRAQPLRATSATAISGVLTVLLGMTFVYLA
jgi:urease accessory protein